MRIALITDTHFGGKNDNLSFSTFQRRFYEGTFFPILDREGISTVVHLGDTFDRRKYSNFLSLKLAKEMFFDPIKERGIDLHVLIGNHDCYYKTTNKVNSMSLTCKEYNIHLYEEVPEVINPVVDMVGKAISQHNPNKGNFFQGVQSDGNPKL